MAVTVVPDDCAILVSRLEDPAATFKVSVRSLVPKIVIDTNGLEDNFLSRVDRTHQQVDDRFSSDVLNDRDPGSGSCRVEVTAGD